MILKFIAPALTAAIVFAASTPVQAQAARTFVSRTGNDASANCDASAPCKTFASAFAKTTAGGEISVLDTGEYGPVSISKSITISNEGGGVAMIRVGSSSADGINILSGLLVTLRGLDIDGSSNSGFTTIGIRAAGGELHVQNCTIRNFNGPASTDASGGAGILFEPNGGGKLFVSDTNVQNNGNASGGGGGIVVRPQSGGAANAVLTRVQSEGNSNAIVADSSAASGFVNVTIADSSASGGSRHGIQAIGGGGGVDIFVNQSRIASNGSSGLRAEGSGARIFYSGSVITNNGVGVTPVSPGLIISNGTNQNRGNFTQGAPTSTVAQD